MCNPSDGDMSLEQVDLYWSTTVGRKAPDILEYSIRGDGVATTFCSDVIRIPVDDINATLDTFHSVTLLAVSIPKSEDVVFLQSTTLAKWFLHWFRIHLR